MNRQPSEPPIHSDGLNLDIHSIVFTINPDGPCAGYRAIMIRMAGCNVCCPGCDANYTTGRKMMDITDILGDVIDLAAEHNAAGCLVVLTGGEPLRQSIGRLVGGLLAIGHPVHIETNGTLAPDETLIELFSPLNHLTLIACPKTSVINDTVIMLAKFYKYPLDARFIDPTDGLPYTTLGVRSSESVARPPKGKPVYVIPMETQEVYNNWQNLGAVIDSCLKFGYIAGVRLNRLLGLP